ncbi:MAG: tetratricopeptide (TPR) repeat protein [Lentimonas sp.]|jgi:tetratricopeptide (TPR) repeat protein
MKIDSSLSKWLLMISLLFATSLLQADKLDSKALIANWTELSETRTQQAGAQIFEQAISELTPIQDEDPEKAAELFFKAAEFCRDINDVKHAITLFDLAIDLNPEDPHFRRVYGDYLIGYRGLEEQAWAQFYKARELAKTYPEKVNDEFRATLNRSIHIFRRDTRDGVLTFERNRSDGALIFEDENITITGGFETSYRKIAKDPLDLSTDYYRALSFYDQQGYLVGLPGDDLNALDRKLDRQLEASETLVSFLFRTPNANLPSVRLSYFNSYAFESSLNFDGLDDPYDSVNDLVALEFEKTFVIANDLFLEGDLGFLYLNQQGRNTTLPDFADHSLALRAGLNFRKEWGTSDGIVSLNVGGDYSRDLYDFEAYPIHQQGISLRNFSFLEEPSANENRQRFRGRRTSSQEIGFGRAERREGSPDAKEENWRFFVANEELGLVDGIWDIYTSYTYRERNLSDVNYGDGSYSVHEFSVEPIWVPVFELYDNDFVSGWEFVTVGFPVSVSKDDGPFDSVVGGITFGGQYVVSQAKLTLGFSIGVEYAHYTEVDEEDLGGFIRLSIF